MSLKVTYETKKFKQGYTHIIGCDEVGRGCLAGPVVAAAVCFDFTLNKLDKELSKLINDSKLLSPKRRAELDVFIRNNCISFGIGLVDVHHIEKMNIHNASMYAMKRAVEALAADQGLNGCKSMRNYKYKVSSETIITRPRDVHVSTGNEKQFFLFVDGKFPVPGIPLPQEAVVDGDAKIFSVAAASIVAKVYRDNLMAKMDKKFPGYGFAKHKGYGTLHHITAIKKLGLSPLHRKSFCGNYIK